MKKIASFCVDHNKLNVGMYTSRIDDDITTYDIRMTKPNGGIYLENDAMHTFEHLFATYARNSAFEDSIVYVGPMGCRTGFYFLVRSLSKENSIKLVKEAMSFIAAFEGDIPGVSQVECGNYKEHNLMGAKKMANDMAVALSNWTVEMLAYA